MKRKITALMTAVLMTLTVALFPCSTVLAVESADTQNWANVGAAGFSTVAAGLTSLVFDHEGTPYVAFRDLENSRKTTVMKYNGSSWETVGTADFSAGEADYISLALDDHGTPYVAYQDVGYSYKATVMKYTGSGTSGWETVGTAGFSAGEADNTSLALDGDGTPYVAYTDYGNSHKATVMKYNGSSWETVGTVGFSADQAWNISLALDSVGTPYVAYMDYGNSYKATVMKYNGSSWEAVGTAGFSASSAFISSLAFDSEGTLYVAYQDGGNDNKATVMKYNGSSWETVGTADFSAGEAYHISLALDDHGTPYVAYQDVGYSYKATVMKYNGSSWTAVGSAVFSAGTASCTSLAFDHEGTPYVAYVDGRNGYKATLTRLNNPPTDLDLDNQSVSEEKEIGTAVGTLSAQDPDRFENYTYSLVSGSGDEDNSAFSINGDQLKTAKVFDYETKHIYNIRVRVADVGGLYYEQKLTVAVQNIQGDANDNSIVVDMGPVPGGTVGSSFSFTPAVTKGTAPYTWTATGLPAGLNIDSATGKISGTPSAAGTSSVSATVTDSQDAVLTVNFDITIGYSVDLTSLSVSDAVLSPAFDQDKAVYSVSTVSDTASIIKIRATTEDANAALTINGEAAVSGAETTVGLENGKNLIPVVVTSQDGKTQKSYILSVNGTVSDADLNSLSVSGHTLNETFSPDTTEYTLGVSNSASSIELTAETSDSGALVLVNGTLVDSGNSTEIALDEGDNAIEIMVVAQDASTKTYTITITREETMTITTDSLPLGMIGALYNTTLTAIGGSSSYTWSASSLPEGFTLSADGVLSGTTETAGQFPIVLKATDTNGNTATKPLTLTIKKGCGNGAYAIESDGDSAYTGSYSDSGLLNLTVNDGVTGLTYFSVDISAVTGHDGKENCLFVQKRNGAQIGFSFNKADYDTVAYAGAGFNVKPGDVVEVYIVDSLSNGTDSAPHIL